MAANENPAYPDKLQTSEEALIKTRPGRENFKRDELVGVGLSGGGIRSATFCLGVFQALGNLGLLKKIDYTSSVSGGGYFASFYGRLFTRDEVIRLDQVAGILAPDDTHPLNAGTDNWMRKTFRWLRENGRYLAPHGAGDLLLDISVVLRNWLSVQIIIAIFVLMFFLLAQLIRAHAPCPFKIDDWDLCEFFQITASGGNLWWSLYLVPGLALLIFFALPAGWAYWLLGGQRARSRSIFSLPGLKWLGRLIFFDFRPWLLPIAILIYAYVTWDQSSKYVRVAALVSFMTIAFAAATAVRAWIKSREQDGHDQNIDPSDIAANLLSRALKVALIASFSCIAFALIDTVGLTAYAQGLASSWKWLVPLVGPLALAVPLAPFAQWIVANLGAGTKGKPVSIPIGIVAVIGAAVVIIPMLVLLDYVSHAIAYGGEPAAATMQSSAILWGLATTVSFSWFVGRSWRFLNNSSLHTLYTARLVRAYLGASNPDRHSHNSPVTDVMPGDDIPQEEYWVGANAGAAAGGDAVSKGAPLHLVNVTINETYGGRSTVEQHDRKGIGMAIGPMAISAGVEHHVVFRSAADHVPLPRWWQRPARWLLLRLRTKNRPAQYQDVSIFPAENQPGARAFRYRGNVYDGQRLALGSWTAISGAAVSTAIGSRTNLALSLLTGFFNVRLGYWWDARVSSQHPRRTVGGFLGRLFGDAFPVQRVLLNEFLARFPGTSERHWYLTDGGHFENMGGYELIRRRLPLIVIIDAEGDENYTFSGLAGLVQKARLDFGAEIEFLNSERLDDRLGKYHPMRKHFGTLDQLRRGTWTEEPVDDPATEVKRLTLNPPALDGFSLAHAALAKINYAGIGNPSPGWMIVIKPTLTGDEPADVLRYHGDHPAFPHESTADQFFAEAQWESYRKLGEHITTRLFDWDHDSKPFPTFSRA